MVQVSGSMEVLFQINGSKKELIVSKDKWKDYVDVTDIEQIQDLSNTSNLADWLKNYGQRHLKSAPCGFLPKLPTWFQATI